MKELPEYIDTVEQLDEVLTRPSEALVDFMRTLKGDIMIIGAGGKMGPTVSMMAKHAVDAAGVNKKIIAVARRPLPEMETMGIVTVMCDLLEADSVSKLPEVENIIYMAGRKFGSTGSEWLTWAANCIIPSHVAGRFLNSNIVVFSTGCVYPVVHVDTGGSLETDSTDPTGEYSISCLGRERIFDYFSAEKGEKIIHIRLNYSLELRYGVLVDIAEKVFNSEPIDLTTGYFNGIWQGDACDQILRSLTYTSSPGTILNITGTKIISVRKVAEKFGRIFNKEIIFKGHENGMGYLSNASKAEKLFGPPSVSGEKLIEWVAHWVRKGGENLGKPTHFEEQNGKY